MSAFKKRKTALDTLEYDLQVWEKTLDVQMHFNELQMKIRNFGILLVSALVGVAGIALREHAQIDLNLFGLLFSTNLTSVLFGIASILWLCFYFMDLFWYHPLLIGSVKHGAKIEAVLKMRMPTISLGEMISKESALEIWNIKLHSHHKSSIFYFVIFALLLASSVASAWVTASLPAPDKSLALPVTKARIAVTALPIRAPSAVSAGVGKEQTQSISENVTSQFSPQELQK